LNEPFPSLDYYLLHCILSSELCFVFILILILIYSLFTTVNHWSLFV